MDKCEGQPEQIGCSGFSLLLICSGYLCATYNGLPVCALCERVNRYTVTFLNMLTTLSSYGMIRLRWLGGLPVIDMARLGEGKQ